MEAKSFPTSLSALAAPASADLVARAQRGEEAAFAALFDAHKRDVYTLCLRMTGNAAEAENLTQEAFLQAFRQIAAIGEQSRFSTSLRRLAVSEVLMHLRKRRRLENFRSETHTSALTVGELQP